MRNLLRSANFAYVLCSYRHFDSHNWRQQTISCGCANMQMRTTNQVCCSSLPNLAYFNLISSFQACLKWSNKPIAFDCDCSCKPLSPPCRIADRILGALSSPPFTAAPFKYHLPLLAAAAAGYLIDTLLQRPPHTIPPSLLLSFFPRLRGLLTKSQASFIQ